MAALTRRVLMPQHLCGGGAEIRSHRKDSWLGEKVSGSTVTAPVAIVRPTGQACKPPSAQERKLPGAAHLAGPALLWRNSMPTVLWSGLSGMPLNNSVTFSLLVLMNSACLKLPR